MHISVGDLVAHLLRSGDLTATFSGPGRARLGTLVHQRLQKSRPPDYRAEVPVSYQIETDRLILTVDGRLDGVFAAAKPPIIEEIKSTTGDPDRLLARQNPVHWGQVLMYASIYAREEQLDSVIARLTYCDIESEQERFEDRPMRLDQLEAFRDDLLARYLRWAHALADWQHRRNASIAALEFPFGNYRPGQREMAVALFRTLREKGQLLVQAPTGIGKSAAALFPAIKMLHAQPDARLFYLTARTTGQKAAKEALGHMRRGGLRLKSVILTAKEKICFVPEGTCSGEECEYARGHYDRMDPARWALFEHDDFDGDTIAQLARHHRVCPFELALELAFWAECIIGDYNYAFDPRAALRRHLVEDTRPSLLLIDEAHNLVDRSREMFSAELDKKAVYSLQRRLKTPLPRLHRDLGSIYRWMLKQRKQMVSQNQQAVSQPERPDKIVERLQRFARHAEKWLARNLKSEFRADLLEFYFAAHAFLRVAEQYDSTYCTLFEASGRDWRIRLYCLDPAGPMAANLARCQAAVFFSATLSPSLYYSRMFGCRSQTPILQLASPFAPENLQVMIWDRMSTYYREREASLVPLTRLVAHLASGRPANYLVFLPSYQYLQMLFEKFVQRYPDLRAICQQPHMDADQRAEFLGCFAQNRGGTEAVPSSLVGFAVMGGIFGEGIDLTGEQLSGVVVVGVGLPAICLERDLIRDYFAENDAAGFEFAYMYPGIQRVLQAAGRVIRTESDRGVVVLVDRRYGQGRYRRLLPEAWRCQRFDRIEEMDGRLRPFWAADPASQDV